MADTPTRCGWRGCKRLPRPELAIRASVLEVLQAHPLSTNEKARHLGELLSRGVMELDGRCSGCAGRLAADMARGYWGTCDHPQRAPEALRASLAELAQVLAEQSPEPVGEGLLLAARAALRVVVMKLAFELFGKCPGCALAQVLRSEEGVAHG
jgi:hypothetical protein